MPTTFQFQVRCTTTFYKSKNIYANSSIFAIDVMCAFPRWQQWASSCADTIEPNNDHHHSRHCGHRLPCHRRCVMLFHEQLRCDHVYLCPRVWSTATDQHWPCCRGTWEVTSCFVVVLPYTLPNIESFTAQRLMFSYSATESVSEENCLFVG